eukprot:TRINITY_DN90241_c0_g1_i1.p1 TRINITY_DN90241_c0_g1~~TRINITY_DN90241_c0_g1_i1.p1  ORF type:complete len:481 (+),score=73.50 TRINITY_DN90241_c0_g1_i1:152-1594(+)
MYYLSRLTGPCPAEAPVVATADDRYEWDYAQRKHQAALRTMKGQVDQSKPKSINPNARAVQKRTRSFCEDQRRAEIGRENRKLVERLASISKGYGGNDPSGPPRMSTMSKACDSTLGDSGRLPQSSTQQSFSEAARKMKQRVLDHENAALVRRILATGSTFDRKAESRSFHRHKRNVNLLQRLPAEPTSPSRKRASGSLPPLRHARPLSVPCEKLRGLEELFIPGELRRSGSGPTGGYGGVIMFATEGGLGRPAAARTQPLKATRHVDEEDFSTEESAAPSGAPYSQRGAYRLPRDSAPPSLGRLEGLKGAGNFEPQRDQETERRRWLAEQEEQQRLEETLREAPSGDLHRSASDARLAGASHSDLKYAEDDWDDGSFSATSPQGGGRGADRGRDRGDFDHRGDEYGDDRGGDYDRPGDRDRRDYDDGDDYGDDGGRDRRDYDDRDDDYRDDRGDYSGDDRSDRSGRSRSGSGSDYDDDD